MAVHGPHSNALDAKCEPAQNVVSAAQSGESLKLAWSVAVLPEADKISWHEWDETCNSKMLL